MSGSTTTPSFFYTYVLKSLKSQYRYVGFTDNLMERLLQHNQGLTFSTRPYRPFELVYFEGRKSKIDARRREKYLKTTGGRRFLAKRIKNFPFSQ
ncbi:MAG: GIY-YIG nuclease family protein [Candidatus Kerfeldbacteria bacterium]|nr:GIY-YIG nuclease family protein [Candidatus Kerfeldbacteria bacterium]